LKALRFAQIQTPPSLGEESEVCERKVLIQADRGCISEFDNEMPKRIQPGGSRSDQELYGGLIRLHILHHASKRPVFGLWFIEELGRHGYKLSPGTLYPLLHGLEEKGYLRSIKEREGKQLRRFYQATPLGRKALMTARQKVSELFGELLEDE
jgi:PadR family transcriptional regulator